MHGQQPGSIVVGVDGSPNGTDALEWAAGQASVRGLPMHLIHAFSPDLPMVGFGAGTDAETIKEAGRQLLASCTARVHSRDRSIQVSTALTSGFPSASIIRSGRDAEVIVVGAHGHGPANFAPLGGVAYQVVTHAPCPVAVIRHRDADVPYGRVVVGVDGSAPSLRALVRGFRQAAQRGAELLVVHAWQAQGADDPTLTSGSDWPAYEAVHEAQVRRTIADAQSTHPEVKVIQEVARGLPAKTLVDRSEGADVLLVGDRGLGGFRGLQIGSVAMGSVARASCPTIVCRAPHH
ncbi:universal stress protein [Janibacter sp. G1551]|uniref:universal stress protein n=1 Tax=Janibacter sp. G1551 TaxID=3420440 RepID=UPI003D035136